MLEAEKRLEALKYWCNTWLIGNLLTKHDFDTRDMFPYSKPSDRTEEHRRIFHCPSVSNEGTLVDLSGYKPIIQLPDKRIQNIEIRYPSYTPQTTFEQYLQKHTP